MSSVMQTPPRPFPGTWVQTPGTRPPAPPSFKNSGSQVSRSPFSASGGQPTSLAVTPSSQPAAQPNLTTPTTTLSSQSLTPAQRAARTINETFDSEKRFPELDSYLSQGYSSEYDIQSSNAWAPFEKVRMHNIPDAIFEQYNRAQVSTSMGLFAELHYAWVAIDNALYMWDYTAPSPELVGFESQPNSITAVRLAVPRVGVFLPSIRNMIVLATTSEILVLGLGIDPSSSNSTKLSLFATGMAVSVKGMDISVIASSAKTGRVFFGGRMENELYELTYQQEDRWFSSSCAKVCHTGNTFAPFGLQLGFSRKMPEHMEQMVVDDTRDLVYTLSSTSEIRVFHMKSDGKLTLAITKSADEIYSNIAHIIQPNESLNPKTKITSISQIPAEEASRYHLVATTVTGYRIYLSATSSSSWSSTVSRSSMSMQAQHVKTPPVNIVSSAAHAAPESSLLTIEQGLRVNQPIKTLTPSRSAARYSPGYFFCFASLDAHQPIDQLFISTPDAARLARPTEAGQPSKSSESAVWLSLGSRAEDIGISATYSPPTTTPLGFGNELAVQFDGSIPEVAVLTNTGVHVLRRRRLVDIFAAVIQKGGSTEGAEGGVKNFIRSYGRTETLASALAVACRQGTEVSPDSRVAQINDPQVLEVARKVFIDYGGKPTINQNAIADQNVAALDTVRPSPRHGGMALYLSRLLRSTWKTFIAKENRTPVGYSIRPAVPLEKLRSVQKDLSGLQDFLKTNKSFIQGLSGPDVLSRSSSKQEEIALQGEHRALHSLVKFVSDAIEGISFVLVLFDERVEEILPLLPEQSRPVFLKLTFEELFGTKRGSDIARELVKAIVNRNIAKGSNVETVAEALRRRCGSFCSAQDVVIFKAQEQLKRATEIGPDAELSRNLLNESLILFQQVADGLSQDYLESAIKQFTSLQFFAGAIQLVLKVAQQSDKANEALSWMADGRPEPDARKEKFDYRSRCYDLVHDVINAVDQSTANAPLFVDGRPTLIAARRNEAYDVISKSNDEVFLTNLYDWYLLQGWQDRLLQTDSPFIVKYLQRRSADDIGNADLLWRYYGQSDRLYDAATVQLQLARSGFKLPLDRRIEYLSRARANASAYSQGASRKSKQKLLQEINELLDVANIQDEILQRLKIDPRLASERRQEVLGRMDGPILTITELFNDYADNAGYHDVCLLIYHVADHRDTSQIKLTWQQHLHSIHSQAVERGTSQPWEAVAEGVRSLGSRLRLSESTFPVDILLPMLEKYSVEPQRNFAPPNWVVDLFSKLQVPDEKLFDVLEAMFYTNDSPFAGPGRKVISADLIWVIKHWLQDSIKGGGMIFGSEAGALRVDQMLQTLLHEGSRAGLDDEMSRMCRLVRDRIAQLLH